MKKINIGIIGAGPAGIMAAIHAAHPNANITLIDKQAVIGGKIAVSGKGQCNFAHRGTIDHYLKSYGDNGKFLSHMFKAFFVDDAIDFFESLGINSVTEKNGKIFPKSKNARAIICALETKLHTLGVELCLNTAVISIHYKGSQWRIKTNTQQTYVFDSLVIANGGASFQQMGTTGDAEHWFKSLNLNYIPLKPALTGIVSSEDHQAISGITLNQATITAAGKQKIGELLITHKGYSGPVMHNMSRYIEQGLALTINWQSWCANELRQDLVLAANKKGSQTLNTYLTERGMPKKLLNFLLTPQQLKTKLAELSKANREHALKALTSYKVNNPQCIGFKTAMATKGGLALTELSKKTCRLKTYPTLYAVGEVVDIDGDTGGYNIMAAISMGVAAGRAIASQY